MNKKNISAKCRKIMGDAIKIAGDNNLFQVEVSCFCEALFDQDDSFSHIYIFDKMGIDNGYIAQVLSYETKDLKKTEDPLEEIPFGKDVKELLVMVDEFAEKYNYGSISSDHLALAIISYRKNFFNEVLLGVMPDSDVNAEAMIEKLSKNLSDGLNPNLPKADEDLDLDDIEFATISGNTRVEFENSILEKYSKNLSQMDRDGSIGEVFDRDKELDKVIQTLLRKNKPNPILLGDAGVGKTMIAYKFAKETNNIDSIFYGYQVYELDISRMVAGTKYRGEFEEKMSGVISEAEERKDVILFIDEIHMLVGSGSSESTNIDGSNMMKPALARGSIKLIGATTHEEYKNSIGKDSALQRRFESINIKQPSVEHTKSILLKAKGSYENHHNVEFSEEIVSYIVDLCESYIFGRSFPDKAFDVIDLVGSMVRSKGFKVPQRVIDLEDEILKIESLTIKEFSKMGVTEEDLKKQYSEKYEEFELEHENWIEKNKERVKVKKEDVECIVAQKSKVSINTIKNSNSKIIKQSQEDILKKIFGQDEAVKKVFSKIKIADFGIRDFKKPMASFLFAGSTGVGKTFLAKSIAESMYGNKDRIVRFDMSEYSSDTSFKKLIGGDPGYVGFENGGSLIEAVNRMPHGVILFDEIEKSHMSVRNLLLQILEEGEITDNAGKKANFSNIIIIATTNATGVKKSDKGSSVMGFMPNVKVEKVEKDLKSLEAFFTPELISRFDVIQFSELNEDDNKKLVEKDLSGFKAEIKKMKDINLTYSKNIIDFLSKSDKIQSGARAVISGVSKRFKSKFVDFSIDNPKLKNIKAKLIKNEIEFEENTRKKVKKSSQTDRNVKG